jgi:hypothetical protein
MPDRPKQRPRRAPDFVSGRTEAGDIERLRRSVETLLARSRMRTEDAATRERTTGLPPPAGEQ